MTILWPAPVSSGKCIGEVVSRFIDSLSHPCVSCGVRCEWVCPSSSSRVISASCGSLLGLFKIS